MHLRQLEVCKPCLLYYVRAQASMAVLAGVFDGHGIQGRCAALAGSEAVLKHLQADPRLGPHSITGDWERMFADACVQVRALHPAPGQQCSEHGSNPNHLVHPEELVWLTVRHSLAPILKSLRRPASDWVVLLMSQALTQQFLAQADADLARSTQLNAEYSGTTACMAMVHNGTVYVANVGDSGACLGRLGPNGRTQAMELSKYAKPNDPQVIAGFAGTPYWL